MLADSKTYLRLFGLTWQHRKILLVSAVLTLFVGASTPILPILLEHIVENFEARTFDNIGYISASIVVVFGFRGAAQFVAQTATGWIHQQVLMNMRNALIERLVYMPTTYYDLHNTGKTTSRVLYEPVESISATVKVFFTLVRDTMIVVSLLGYMLYSAWQLALIIFAFVPALIAAIYYFGKHLRRIGQGAQEAMANLTRVLFEIVDGHNVIRSYNTQDYEIKRFKETTKQLKISNYKFTVAQAANTPIVQLMLASPLALLTYVAAQQIAAGSISIGTFVGFSTTAVMLFVPVRNLTGVNATLQRGIAAATKVFALLDEPCEEDNGCQDIAPCRGQLTFNRVCFSYPQQQHAVFDDFQLEIAAGEMVAVVGLSGSGKSTLSALCIRMYDIISGNILLDGIDLRDIPLASLRKNIVVVSQDTVLFDDTVTANIVYGQESFDPERFDRVIRDTAAASFIDALPQRAKTRIGSRGVLLSGGQRQRLGIARGLMRDAPILILDESTSALDNKAERHIQHMLTQLRKGRTTIIIAHRLSTIKNVDRIVVLDQGKIVGVGTHHELSRHNQLYASLYKLEASNEPTDKKASSAPALS